MQPSAFTGIMFGRKAIASRWIGRMAPGLLFAAMLLAAPASAQRRVFTNEDIGAAPVAPPPAAAAPSANATDAASASPAAVAGEAPAEEATPAESQQLAVILKALGQAQEYLIAKAPSEPSSIITARWATMGTQIVAMMGEFNRLLEEARRAEQKQAAESVAPPATPIDPAVPQQ